MDFPTFGNVVSLEQAMEAKLQKHAHHPDVGARLTVKPSMLGSWVLTSSRVNRVYT